MKFYLLALLIPLSSPAFSEDIPINPPKTSFIAKCSVSLIESNAAFTDTTLGPLVVCGCMYQRLGDRSYENVSEGDANKAYQLCANELSRAYDANKEQFRKISIAALRGVDTQSVLRYLDKQMEE